MHIGKLQVPPGPGSAQPAPKGVQKTWGGPAFS